jgi:hypothetical protein
MYKKNAYYKRIIYYKYISNGKRSTEIHDFRTNANSV